MTKLNFMLIDDEDGSLEILREFVQQAGHSCQTFSNPSKAVNAYNAAEYDVVMTDFRMPQMTGLEVLQFIRTINNQAIVMIVTGYGNEEMAAEARRLGAYAFLYKPLDAYKLFAVLDEIKHLVNKRRGNIEQKAELPEMRRSVPPVKKLEHLSPEEQELNEIFFEESTEMIALASAGLLAAEKSERHQDAVPEVFRAFHSIKGGAQSLGLDMLAELAHRMEDVLDSIRQGERLMDSRIVSLILEAMDLMEKEIACYAVGENPDDLMDFQRDLLALALAVQRPAKKQLGTIAGKDLSANEPVIFADEKAESGNKLTAKKTENISEQTGQSEEPTKIEPAITEHNVVHEQRLVFFYCRFAPETPMLAVQLLLQLCRLREFGEILYSQPAAAELEGDGLQAGAEFMALLRTGLSKQELAVCCANDDFIASRLLEVLPPGGLTADDLLAPVLIAEQLKSAELMPKITTTQNLPPEQKAEEVSNSVIAAAIEPSTEQLSLSPELVQKFAQEGNEMLAVMETALLTLEAAPVRLELVEEAFRAAHTFKGNAGFMGFSAFEEVSHALENLLTEIRAGRREVNSPDISLLLETVDALREAIRQFLDGRPDYLQVKEQLLANLNKSLNTSPAVQVTPQITAESLTLKLPEIEITEELPATLATRKTAEQAVADNKKQQPEVTKTVPVLAQQAIRVDIDKIDKLMDSVGELVIAETMVANSPIIKLQKTLNFKKQVVHMGKIIRDIQDLTMSMRMIPLTATFQKMARLVRDVALKVNKKVDLVIIGDETEVDKTVIEQIGDPLMHLVRNAVDHGLETPQQRQEKGKEETGHVTLEARHSAGEVWILVKDDGQGLDRERILHKARAQGLVTGDGSTMKDEDVWRLIFEAGLSTAEKVTAISGRGVGMDVVKRNIEKIRGRIDVRSSKDQGTILILRIPLTLAIIEGMIIRVGDSRYTIPIIAICQSFRPRREQITMTPTGDEVVNVRGQLLPVVRLHDFYRIEPRSRELTDGILVIVETEEDKCCLFVDELVGQQQIVIKGMPEYLQGVRGAAGLAVLGDGEASLILDINSLVKHLGKGSVALAAAVKPALG